MFDRIFYWIGLIYTIGVIFNFIAMVGLVVYKHFKYKTKILSPNDFLEGCLLFLCSWFYWVIVYKYYILKGDFNEKYI